MIPKNLVLVVSNSGTMDEDLMIEYINRVLEPILKTQPDSCLIMDDFKAHSTERVINRLDSLKMDHKIIPGGLSSELQPCDMSLNNPFKDHYREKWNEWMNSPYPIYTKSGNRQKLSYQELVNWVSFSLNKLAEQSEGIFCLHRPLQSISRP